MRRAARVAARRAGDRPDELRRRRAPAARDPRRGRRLPAQGRRAGRPGPRRAPGPPRRGAARPVRGGPLVEALAQPPGAAATEPLTPREREVLALVARGFANKRIARELGIAEKTVKTHVGPRAGQARRDRPDAGGACTPSAPGSTAASAGGPRTKGRFRPAPGLRHPGPMPIAIVTGASRGLGLALTRALAARGWRVVVDARDGAALRRATAHAARAGRVVALAGDVTDPRHRRALAEAAGDRVDLLVNNASALGPSPRPALADFPLAALEDVLRVNVVAPLALAQLVLPRMPRRRRRRERHVRRRGRALRRLGRLRRLEGGARAAHRGPRRRAPRAARPGGRPRRPAHPACTRTPSPARTSPTARRPRPPSPACSR